jgi:hypothetical protein
MVGPSRIAGGALSHSAKGWWRLEPLRQGLHRSFGSRYAAVVPAPILPRLMRNADVKTTLTFYTDGDGVLDDSIWKA